ncbi:ATP-binding protein [Streptomyces durmitorensis]|uniref:ATP-binding protein n=1 Tax=Streptomyces durmitorensis TaxID=319947 RepID=A0ABY4Q4C6_9ACTN|nr:ATP-binding protein [Streptomyces durmitorensis]UQT60078.1 ATP-binding protein [Streptomyces durmitorensis]
MKTHGMRLDTGPSDQAVFDKRPEAVAHARDFARAFVDRLHPPVGSQDAASIELAVSELVTNAVRHARGASCSLRLQAEPDGVAVVVGDADPRPPRERAPDLVGGTGGFGWPMVQHMAKAVTVTSGPRGKTIRAVLPR